MSETTHRGLRLALASLLVVALLARLAIGLSRSTLTVANFFSFFTILSTGSAAVLLVFLAFRPGRDANLSLAVFRGAVTVYVSLTVLAYTFPAAPVASEVGASEPWIDWSIHLVAPVAIATDWILYPPRIRLPASTVAIWLLFPTVYLAYSLIRGAIVDWYPYPFLDPSTGGYPTVALWSATVLAVTLVFGYGYFWWSNRATTVSQPT